MLHCRRQLSSTLLSFVVMQQFSALDRISRQGCSFSNLPTAAIARAREVLGLIVYC